MLGDNRDRNQHTASTSYRFLVLTVASDGKGEVEEKEEGKGRREDEVERKDAVGGAYRNKFEVITSYIHSSIYSSLYCMCKFLSHLLWMYYLYT